MRSAELADEVARVVTDAQSRIMGVGDEQYSEGLEQKFESKTITELLQDAEEETIDLVNYGVMLSIQIRRMREFVKNMEEKIDQVEADINNILAGKVCPECGSSFEGDEEQD